LAAVTHNGIALQYATIDLQADKEVALAAVGSKHIKASTLEVEEIEDKFNKKICQLLEAENCLSSTNPDLRKKVEEIEDKFNKKIGQLFEVEGIEDKFNKKIGQLLEVEGIDEKINNKIGQLLEVEGIDDKFNRKNWPAGEDGGAQHRQTRDEHCEHHHSKGPAAEGGQHPKRLGEPGSAHGTFKCSLKTDIGGIERLSTRRRARA